MRILKKVVGWIIIIGFFVGIVVLEHLKGYDLLTIILGLGSAVLVTGLIYLAVVFITD